MNIFRFFLLTILFSGLFLALILELVSAIRTGKIRYGRNQGEKVAIRKKQPLFFNFLVLLFTCFAIGCIAVIVWFAYTSFK